MDSDSDTLAGGLPHSETPDQRFRPSPPGFSQRATSFIASQCQGIHQMPFVSRLSTTPNGKDQCETQLLGQVRGADDRTLSPGLTRGPPDNWPGAADAANFSP